MGILDDYFDGYYSEEMIESQVFFFRFRSHLFYLAEVFINSFFIMPFISWIGFRNIVELRNANELLVTDRCFGNQIPEPSNNAYGLDNKKMQNPTRQN